MIRTCGLTLHLDGVADGSHPPADVEVHLAGTPAVELPPERHHAAWRPVPTLGASEGFRPSVLDDVDGRWFDLSYTDGVRSASYRLDPSGSQLWATWNDATELPAVLSMLFGPVVGWVARIRGTLCLHASVVVVDDRAVAFVGDTGAGKSTMAGALVGRGYAMLADDVAALTETADGFMAHPATPYPRRTGFRADTLPLGAVYVLEPRGMSPKPILRADRPTRDVAMLAARLAPRQLPAERERVAFEMQRLGRLVTAVPVRRLERPDALAALPAACDVILNDVRRMG